MIFSPIAALAGNIFFQIVFKRLGRKQSVPKSVIAGFVFGLAMLAGLQTAFFTGYWDLACDAISYLALGYCYFHFVNLGETARRARILRELNSADGGLALDDIQRLYDSREMLEKRVGRLILTGQAVYTNGRVYSRGSAILLMAKCLVFLRKFMMGRPFADTAVTKEKIYEEFFH